MLTRNDFSKSMTSSFIKAKKESIFNSKDNSPVRTIIATTPSIRRIKLSKQSFLQSRCRSRAELGNVSFRQFPKDENQTNQLRLPLK